MLASFIRNALGSATSWLVLLATAIVVPILTVTLLFVRDIDGLIGATNAERDGIAHLAVLDRTLADAWAYRAAQACGAATPAPAAIDDDIAALTALEHRRPILGDTWKDAAAAWSATGDDTAGAESFVARLVPLFEIVADRSGITYDTNEAGLNYADAAAYRLPRAFDMFERMTLVVCRPGAAAHAPLALARLTGFADVLLGDGYDDVIEALKHDAPAMPTVGARRLGAVRATTATFALLERFEVRPHSALLAAAAGRDTVAASRALDGLIATLPPAMDRITRERLDALHRRYALTLVPGILATFAAAFLVFTGARSVLARSELSRMTQAAAELSYHATHDELTGLPNRTAFVTALEAALARCATASDAIAVLFIDLDNFKIVNDSLGHAAGDTVLRAVADRLRGIGDEHAGSFIARFGGDEFAMLVELRASDAAACIDGITARLRDDFAQPLPLRTEVAQRIVVGASVGIAAHAGGSQSALLAADLLRDADVAMYEAKAGGRSRAALFGPAMRERAVRKLRLITDLRGAAARDEFFLASEPIVRLASGMPVGSEALIRWRHPQLGVLPPDAFLALAAESGAIVPLGRWVLDAALRRAAGARSAVHVNMTVADLAEESLLSTVARLLAEHAIAPAALAIEITEGTLVRSGDRAEAMLGRLRALGVRIWIDDFGVEYSSLRYLDRLPLDGVKLDRSFIGGTDGGLQSPSIVKMIVELARSLELDVIAEGVETERQRDALLELGCVYGQGFLYTPAARDLAYFG